MAASAIKPSFRGTWRVPHFLLSNFVAHTSFRFYPLLYTYDVALLGYSEKYLTLGFLSVG
jgi:hypothetical protein